MTPREIKAQAKRRRKFTSTQPSNYALTNHYPGDPMRLNWPKKDQAPDPLPVRAPRNATVAAALLAMASLPQKES